MRRLAPWLILVGSMAALSAAQSVSRDGEVWRLENDAIALDVDTRVGTFQVLDKQSGYLWEGPEEAAMGAATLTVPSLQAPPAIDGRLDDWPAGAPKTALSPEMVADAKQVDGPDDLSAALGVAWNQTGLFIGVSVRDETLVFTSEDEDQWWYKDTIEFWLNGTQYAIRFGPWGANVWSAGGPVAGAKAAFAQTQGGYSLEAGMPRACCEQAIGKGIGGTLRFALGINDCDGPDGRQGQLYYPETWAHSNPTTFAVATLGDAQGRVTQEPIPQDVGSLKPLPMDDSDKPILRFSAQAKATAKQFPVEIAFELDGDKPDLLITIEGDADIEPGRFTVLHPLVLDRPNGRILVARYCNGIGVPTEDLSWRGQQWATWSIDMPWVGVTDGDIGYLLLWELPVSCDNGAAVLQRARVGEKAFLAPSPYHYPIRQKLAQPRIIRYSFCPTGGHVAICKRYRQYAKDNGFLVTQQEKMKKKPHLARLAGAPDIWGRGDLKFCQEAKAAGMDRLLVNSAQPWDDMKKIEALGYLMSLYDNYEDAHEGDAGRYGDFVEATDTVIKADGSLMKAWLTKSDPPKQYMKRCSALHEKVARTWVPKELEKHPYNARFIDVTTATGLRECYSETHGLTRTEDRQVKRALAKYIGDELNLVLGGEHGRWWGADIFNYWEGMQSGGFYSWPAGYVGRDLPESRQAIGQRYLEWGLGETNRYPLWELVFHDCVVSTWYWGDSTGHLNAVAPDLAYKKDAFNILYGTVPLYWVSRPFSYNWGEPELRERLLESYRNTCKLHEVIGFQEMTRHEFVTDDRAVQKSTFQDGTEVWVNFGETPWTLKREGKQYTLPQYGFYARGPKVEQYRIAGNAGADAVTYIHTDNYLFAEGNVPGLIESSDGGPQTLRVEAPTRIRLNMGTDTEWVSFDWRQLCPRGGEGSWRVVELDEEGNPAGVAEAVSAQGAMLRVAARKDGGSVLLLGPAELAERVELVAQQPVSVWPRDPNQGQALTIALKVSNVGGKHAENTHITLARDLGNTHEVLATKLVTVPSGETVEIPFDLQTSAYDGEWSFWLKVDASGAFEEVCEADNLALAKADIVPDWSLWDGYIDVVVRADETALRRPVITMPFAMDAERAALGLEGKADLAALRVVQSGPAGDTICSHQARLEGEVPQLSWQLHGKVPKGAQVACRIYMDGATAHRHEARRAGNWVASDSAYSGPWYTVRFEEGYIRGITLHPGGQIISHLGVSSQDTGWVDEVGDVESFEVLQDGPVFTQVRVKKKLRGGHSYDKLYTFYQDHFTVTTLSQERFGNLSRAYYTAVCQFEDDKGNAALIDGKGDAENVSGKNPSPKWYATWADGWGFSCVAVTPHDNLGYWDNGHWAGVGFSTGSKEPATVAYYVHFPQRDESYKAPDFAHDDYTQARAEPVVSRP